MPKQQADQQAAEILSAQQARLASGEFDQVVIITYKSNDPGIFVAAATREGPLRELVAELQDRVGASVLAVSATMH